MPEERACLLCKKPLKGRRDRKYCNEHCRNTYNNEIKSDRHLHVRQINNILKKNRRILEQLLPQNKTTCKAKKETLQRLGFLLDFYTHTNTNKKGELGYFCYEYGYFPTKDTYLIKKIPTHLL